MIETRVPYLPNKLLIREYIWEKVNTKLYHRLNQIVGGQNPYAAALLDVQRQKKTLLNTLIQAFTLLKPALPEGIVQYHHDPHSLMNELMERQIELKVVYQSYSYFLGSSPSLVPVIESLQELHSRQVDLLLEWKKQFPKEKKEEALLKGMKRGYWLNQGYELERIVSGLTFPASIVFDEDGEMYVGEAGFSYGPAVEEARILHIRKNGKICKIASGFKGPLTGFAWHQGYFYVVTGSFNGKVYRVSRTGEKEIIIQGLRGGGDHYTSEIVFGPDGKMYFAVGTTTNSAVVGMDNVLNGWVGLKKKYHDVPARDLKLAGQNFESPNLLDKTNPNARAITGAFRPFGVSCYPGEVAQGQVMANGVIYRANPDGSGLEIVADGMRNVFGLGFLPNGKLYATSNGFDFRGSRPIEGDWDPFYEVNSGWYGWPDFASGLPVTLPYFKPEGNAQPEFILAEHPPIIEQPLIRFKPHSATQKFDYCRNPLFSTINEIFFAQFGSGPPITTDDLEPKGYRIVKANPCTGQVRDFYINFNPGKGGNWPERPLALRFSPSGESLFIVDFGILEATPGTFIPHSDTGAVWRIKRK